MKKTSSAYSEAQKSKLSKVSRVTRVKASEIWSPKLQFMTAKIRYKKMRAKYAILAKMAYKRIVGDSAFSYRLNTGSNKRTSYKLQITVPLYVQPKLLEQIKRRRRKRTRVRFYGLRPLRFSISRRRRKKIVPRRELTRFQYVWRQRLKRTTRRRFLSRLKVRKNRRARLSMLLNYYRIKSHRSRMRRKRSRRPNKSYRKARLVGRILPNFFFRQVRGMVRGLRSLTVRMLRAYFRKANYPRARRRWARSGSKNELRVLTAAVSTSAARRLGLLASSQRIVNRTDLISVNYWNKPLKNAKIYQYRYERTPVVRADLNTLRLRLRRSRQSSRKRKHVRKRMLKLILKMWRKVTLRRVRIRSKITSEGSLRKWRRLKEDFYLLKMLNKILFKRYFPLKAYRLRTFRKRHDAHTQFIQQWKQSAAYMLMHSPLARSRFEAERFMQNKAVFYNNKVLRNPYMLLKRPGVFVQVPMQARQTLRAFYQQPNTSVATRWRSTHYWDTRRPRNYKSLFYHDYFKKTKYWTTNNWETAMWETHRKRFLKFSSGFLSIANPKPSLYIAGLDEKRERFQFKVTRGKYRTPDSDFMQTSIIDFLQKIKT